MVRRHRHDELSDAGAVGPPVGGGMALAAPTILEHGPDALRARLLRRIITGEDTWCQLFSEPGSGSDLAGLTTRAELDGDEWVVNGQKVWNTSAHHADYGMLLARTDWDVPKHRGISYFALPMHQAGVEVRPLRQMNRHASFNEVFLTDARIPVDLMVGEPGEGWRAALTTLAHERRFATMHRPRLPGVEGRAVREARAEADAYFATYSWYPQRAGRADLLIDSARDRGRSGDPVVRQQITEVLSLVRANQWTAQRAQAQRALGRPPGPEGSLGKLAASDVARGAAIAARADRRSLGDARLRGRRARRRRRGGDRVGARGLDCRRHGSDPTQHHRRASARLAEGAASRSRHAVPRRPSQHVTLTSALTPALTPGVSLRILR